MTAWTYEKLKREYSGLWSTMRVDPGRVAAFQATARPLLKSADRYKAIAKATGVPAVLIMILHLRESDGDFGTYFGNGDPLFTREGRPLKSVNEPKGRGPFRNFEEGAIDALKIDGLSDEKDWHYEKAIYYAEKYNGFGYRNLKKYPPIRSPYLWGATNHQEHGKYVSDGVYDPSVMDNQLGAVPMMYTLVMLDLSLALTLETPAVAPVKVPPPPDIEPPHVDPVTGQKPPTGATQAGGVGAVIVAFWIAMNKAPMEWVIGGALLAALVIWIIVHFIMRKG